MTYYRAYAYSSRTPIPGLNCRHRHRSPRGAQECAIAHQGKGATYHVVAISEGVERPLSDREWEECQRLAK